jgi:hypothetical protein
MNVGNVSHCGRLHGESLWLFLAKRRRPRAAAFHQSDQPLATGQTRTRSTLERLLVIDLVQIKFSSSTRSRPADGAMVGTIVNAPKFVDDQWHRTRIRQALR